MSFNPKVALTSGNTQNIDYTPGSAVAAGDVVIVGGTACFAPRDIAASTLGSLAFSGGVWTGNKKTGAIAIGDPIFWNPTADPVTGTAGTGALQNTFSVGCSRVGISVSVSASGDDKVQFIKTSGQGQLRSVSGQLTTVTASDTVVTGLAKVVSVVASLDSDPIDNPEWVSASIGDQAGTPVAGSVLIKTWQNTSGSDPTPTAATTFSKKVNWIAFGY